MPLHAYSDSNSDSGRYIDRPLHIGEDGVVCHRGALLVSGLQLANQTTKERLML